METKKVNFLARLQAEMSESSLMTSWNDVMTWSHDVRASHKWEIHNIFELSDLKNHEKKINFLAQINNIFELGDLQNHGNKKRIIFLANLQAKICIVISVTSWRHVETLWRHMTWHLDNSIQLFVFREDFSITSEHFTNISSIGKKLRQFLSSRHSPPPFTFNVSFFQESMRVNFFNFVHIAHFVNFVHFILFLYRQMKLW